MRFNILICIHCHKTHHTHNILRKSTNVGKRKLKKILALVYGKTNTEFCMCFTGSGEYSISTHLCQHAFRPFKPS